ncbi:DUF4395 domain-containing protein [Amnibacterium endophyticum]|uniref:DUF4395 domain-containing protein n=1 Tax=Amnibacterium endophyticum TaxID=2109337 RepID=A0ABW4LJX9_9MICO
MSAADRLPADRVDPRGPRFGAGITAVLLLVDFVLAVGGAPLAALILTAALALLFAWGAFAGIRRHPWGRIYARFVRPRLAPPAETEDVRPPTFAQGVGFVITALGVLLALVGVPAALPVAIALAFIAAFLNSVFGFCLGCAMYLGLARAFPRLVGV